MQSRSAFPSRLLITLLAACALVSTPASPGDPSAFIQGVANAPPEAQLKMLRIVLNALAGPPDEVRAKFSAACDKRQATPAAAKSAGATVADKPAVPFTANLQARMSGASKEATLTALCATTVRTKIEVSLAHESRIAKQQAAAEAAAAR